MDFYYSRRSSLAVSQQYVTKISSLLAVFFITRLPYLFARLPHSIFPIGKSALGKIAALSIPENLRIFLESEWLIWYKYT